MHLFIKKYMNSVFLEKFARALYSHRQVSPKLKIFQLYFKHLFLSITICWSFFFYILCLFSKVFAVKNILKNNYNSVFWKTEQKYHFDFVKISLKWPNILKIHKKIIKKNVLTWNQIFLVIVNQKIEIYLKNFVKN
jgi:hypothetical protein